MRGKKQFEFTDFFENNFNTDKLSELKNKKSSAAFYGVRGKKLSNDDNDFKYFNDSPSRQNYEYLILLKAMELAANARFHLDPYFEENNNIYKRAPLGFTGMRGKRSFIGARNDGEDIAHLQFKRSTVQRIVRLTSYVII